MDRELETSSAPFLDITRNPLPDSGNAYLILTRRHGEGVILTFPDGQRGFVKAIDGGDIPKGEVMLEIHGPQGFTIGKTQRHATVLMRSGRYVHCRLVDGRECAVSAFRVKPGSMKIGFCFPRDVHLVREEIQDKPTSDAPKPHKTHYGRQFGAKQD